MHIYLTFYEIVDKIILIFNIHIFRLPKYREYWFSRNPVHPYFFSYCKFATDLIILRRNISLANVCPSYIKPKKLHDAGYSLVAIQIHRPKIPRMLYFAGTTIEKEFMY